MSEHQTDDIPVEPPNEEEFELIPTGAYLGKLVGFRVQEKPQWKINAEVLRNPDKEPDKAQWEWTFEFTDGEFAEATISDWTSRSWHSRSKASSYACALLDVPMLPRGQGFTTQKLVGRPCQVWVEAKINSKGEERSYVDKVLPAPKRRERTRQQPAEAQQTAPPAQQAQQAVMAGAAEEDPAYWAALAASEPKG